MSLQVVDVERLVRHPLQPRHDVGDVAELAASIRRVGVLQPIVVAPDPAGGQSLRVLFGHRRWAAALRAGSDQVPVLIRWDLGTDAEQLMTMLVENLHRADLTPVEESEAYEQLRLLDLRPADIARGIGRRKDTVERRLALAKLPGPVREQLHAGQIAIGDAEALVEFAGDPDTAARLAGQLGTPNFRVAVEEERRRREQRAGVARRVTAAAAGGVRIVRPETDDWRWRRPEDGLPSPLTMLAVDEPNDHQAGPPGGCPGAVLIVAAGGTQAFPGCDQPARHGLYTRTEAGAEAGAAGPGGGTGVERAAAEEARARLDEELATAVAVRGAWIRHTLAASTRPRRDQQMIMLRQALLYELKEGRGDGVEILAAGEHGDLLGIRGPTDPDADYAGWVADLELRVRAWPGERLAQAWWALTVAEAHARLGHLHAWRLDPQLAAGFMADLAELGYAPTDVEQRMLAEIAAGADG